MLPLRFRMPCTCCSCVLEDCLLKFAMQFTDAVLHACAGREFIFVRMHDAVEYCKFLMAAEGDVNTRNAAGESQPQ